MEIDYSLIRLKPTFAEAKSLFDPNVTQRGLNYHRFISLSPNETYLQITNSEEGIAFDGDYQVLLVNCADIEIADITDFVAIYEFTDLNGLQQIAFEISPINTDYYYKELYLKFIHTTGSDIWYSNPVLITNENLEETTRFDYKASGYFNGISYDRADFMQSIRLRCYYDRPANETQVSSYNQITTNNTVSGRSSTYRKSAYKFVYANPFIIEQVTTLLEHDIIYIDGIRCTDKPVLNYDERLGASNLMSCDFVASINRSDKYTASFQIHEPLSLVSQSPLGVYTLGSLPESITGTFNKTIVKTTGSVILYDASDNSVVATFTQADITVVDNIFSIALDGVVDANGSYYLKISDGLFEASTETFAGINNTTDWAFSVGSGDWLAADWNNDDFFTN